VEDQFENEFFHSFDHSNNELPDAILHPHNYQPNDIAKGAAKDLQTYLEKHPELHDFKNIKKFDGGGKMFGILVVQNPNKEIGYLAAFSGKIGGKTIVPGFVPPIFDLLDTKSHFLKEEEKITALNQEYEQLINSEWYSSLKKELQESIRFKEVEVSNLKSQILINKKKRQELRKNSNDPKKIEALNYQSALEKIELKNLKNKWNKKIEVQKSALSEYDQKISQTETLRSKLSAQLQNIIFESYVLNNASGENKNMLEVFRDYNNKIPPAASGECAAPKLFQFAYLNNYHPIALAEFWWGENSTREIRKHQYFYPACKSKCEPILSFMLKGLSVEANPLSQKKALPKIDVLFEDDFLIIIDKPSGLLSVAGKSEANSVLDWIKETFPNSSNFTPVHRLDRDTSGVLLITKDIETYIALQKQFLHKEVYKEYIALLDGVLTLKKGTINLPLRPDIDDRPRQMVCNDHGKEAITEFVVIEEVNNITRVKFKPITGRTHQLRVHSSHPLGLNTPIKGDPLYGIRNERLLLHASKIQFIHPKTGEKITVESTEPF